MTLDDLLEQWARWRSMRDDGVLGYAAVRLNVLMSGGIIAGSANSGLLYGIDADSAAAAIDEAVCRLPKRRRDVVFVEYCRVGEQKAKAAGLRPEMAVKTYRNVLSMARQQLAADAAVKRVLKKC